MTRAVVLGCPVDLVDMDAAVSWIVDRAVQAQGAPSLVVTLNPEMIMRAQREPDFRAILERAGLLVPDGIGLVLALRRRGHRVRRVAGVELVEACAERAAGLGLRMALVGAAPGVAARAARVLQERLPGLQVATDSGDPGPAVAERLAAARPHIVCAAYGAGTQERFLDEHLGRIGAPVGVGVGGSLDYLSGTVRRAPAPVRRLGLEWAWRLARQPWRVRRQAALPMFWWRQLREDGRPGR